MPGAGGAIPLAARKESHSTKILIHIETHTWTQRTLNNNRAIWKDTGRGGRVIHHLHVCAHGFCRCSAQLLVDRLFLRGCLSPLLKVELWALTCAATVLTVLRHWLVLLSFHNIQYLLHSDAIPQRFARLSTFRAIEELSAHGQYAHELNEAGLFLGNHAGTRSASAPRTSSAL